MERYPFVNVPDASPCAFSCAFDKVCAWYMKYDFPSYTTPELPIFHDMFLFNLPKIQEVYVVPYGPCEFAPSAVPSIITSSDVASWYDSHIQHGTPMYPLQ